MTLRLPRRAALALLALPGIARAQSARPIRLLVGFAPGGAADTVARLIAPRLGEHLGASIVVENRAGASGTIAASAVAQAAPDGTTLLFTTLSHATNPFLLSGLPFDYATAFAPISQVVLWPQLLAVKNGFPTRNIGEFLAHARANPVSYGTPGNATAQHLVAEMLRMRTGARLEHIPYRGGADAARDLAAGVLDAAFMTTSTALPLLQSGRVQMLAVCTPERLPSYPETPTIAESGVPGFALSDWCAMFAPAGTPDAAIRRIHAGIAFALAQPEVARRLDDLSSPPLGSSPDAFAAFLREEGPRLGEVIRSAGIRVS
ncbi:Bug family tripartite tricarboxylate transporter substrate binding protein [Falsiroseomonas stagni]|uniref:Tripartite-type tricarboxylate transporter, receptor component TctC n=1 Tax=Falsiroseomonas stagni DSM 19981 TaxID=1123062 RepID=A0A1I3XTE9_9PROT|nr:tripartite tricarboxylate transporter substrate-binding protein [Falsiroseomonas stagni]SFK22790.1 Tripartite-type tricarboxylate transporter, receptor component TctC [Falsiroseomonas stagni DSM 19981]